MITAFRRARITSITAAQDTPDQIAPGTATREAAAA